LKNFLPKTYEALERLSDSIGTRNYESTLRRIYPKLENISVDYAILEPATKQEGARRVFVIPAEIGWSDIGSWDAVHGLQMEAGAADPSGNIFLTSGCALDGYGNLISCGGKFTALIGVRDLVIVETKDALLVCPRDRAQDVAKIVKWLEEKRRKDLL
jgi:mannose-1-phosphate guanylyltransferase